MTRQPVSEHYSSIVHWSDCILDYIIEAEPLVNKFISVPKDKGHLNCASFVGGIIEGILIETNFVSHPNF